MRKIIDILFSLVSFLLPKFNYILFNSNPDFSDNPYAVFLNMVNNERYKGFKFIWYVTGDDIDLNVIDVDYKKYKVIRSKIDLLYYSLVSKVVIHSHGWANRKFSFCKYPISVNLWHGLPFKKIARDINSELTLYKDDYFLCPCDKFNKIFNSSLLVDKNSIIKFGLPRNDWFYCDYNGKYRGKKYIVWMPTFKKSKFSDLFNDGDYENEKLSFLEFAEIGKLNTLLVEHDMYLLVKLHPFDILNDVDFIEYSNFHIIKSGDPELSGSKLYSFLGSSSGLITDYSSIFFDYAVLNKPIAFDIYSCNSYQRDIYYDINDVIDDANIINDLKSLIDYILNIDMKYNSNLKFNIVNYLDNSTLISEFIMEKVCE